MNGLLRQAAKFAAIGGGATAVHVLTALALNSFMQVVPLRANFVAFLVASFVSYMGNWYWTFDGNSRHVFSVPRFAALSLACFAVNQAIVYGVVELLHQPLWLAMVPVVIVIPTFGFWLSRTKVFKNADGRA
jgi:putative flippase GtrA